MDPDYTTDWQHGKSLLTTTCTRALRGVTTGDCHESPQATTVSAMHLLCYTARVGALKWDAQNAGVGGSRTLKPCAASSLTASSRCDMAAAWAGVSGRT
jgi:hypothetical protein